MPKVLFDFSDPSAAAAWRSIDDRVIGGRSSSHFRHAQIGHAVFEGVVSLDNKGGFASVRSTPGELCLAAHQIAVLATSMLVAGHAGLALAGERQVVIVSSADATPIACESGGARPQLLAMDRPSGLLLVADASRTERSICPHI